MTKKAQQMRTMFPMGLRDEIRVSTTSLRPGARLMTLHTGRGEAVSGRAREHRDPAPPEPTPPPRPPQRPERAQQAQHAQYAQDLGTTCGGHGHDDVDQGHQDQQPVQHVPAALQVGVFPRDQAQGHHLARCGGAQVGTPPSRVRGRHSR